MNFSDKLKELRTQNKMTQPALGKALGVSERTIRKYETGEMQPSTDNLLKMASIFNVSVDYLLGKPVSAEALQKYVADLSPTELQALQEFIQQELQREQ